MMNWPGALILIFCEAIACFACWCDPQVTAPGGPTLLLVLTTSFCILWPVALYRQGLRANHLPRSAISTRPMGGDSNQEGLEEVPERDSVSAPAERGSHSSESRPPASESTQTEVRIQKSVDGESLRPPDIYFAWWP